MKTRVIVAFSLVPLLFVVLFFTPAWCLPLVLSLVSMLCVQELLGVAHFVRNRRVIVYASVFSAAVPLYFYFNLPRHFTLIGIFLFVVLLFAEGFAKHEETPFSVIGGTFMVSWIFPLFLSSIMFVSHSDNGKFTVILIFIISVITDIFAMLVGMKMGKHKLAPDISPKKTIEGSVGGLLCAVLFTVAYGVALQWVFKFSVNYALLAVVAVVGSLAGQFGDLAMSFVKREFKVKDFGTLLPGHGGILDRLDSIMFTAPLVYISLTGFKLIW